MGSGRYVIGEGKKVVDNQHGVREVTVGLWRRKGHEYWKILKSSWEPDEEKAGAIWWWADSCLWRKRWTARGYQSNVLKNADNENITFIWGIFSKGKNNYLVDRENNGIKWGFVFVFKHIQNGTPFCQKMTDRGESPGKKQICSRIQVDRFGDPKSAL